MKTIVIIILIILVFVAGYNRGIDETSLTIAYMIEESSCLADLKRRLREGGLDNEKF